MRFAPPPCSVAGEREREREGGREKVKGGGGSAEVHSPSRAAEAGGETTDADLSALLETVGAKHEERSKQRGKVAVTADEPAS